MPVLVNGATGMVGRLLVARIAAEGGQVRAFVRRDDAALRAAGAHVAIGDADDEGRLESALEQVHTLVHLVGGLTPERGVSYEWLNFETVTVALKAAENAGVRRVLFLSFPGADPGARNEYLRAKGAAEEAIRAAPMDHAIFRCPQIVGAGGRLDRFLARLRSLPVVPVPGTGRQRLNPVCVDDVVDALVAADSREGSLSGTWDLGGPDVVTFDEFLDAAIGRKRKVHVRSLPGVPRTFSEVYGADALADPATAVVRFGLRLRSLRAALARASLT